LHFFFHPNFASFYDIIKKEVGKTSHILKRYTQFKKYFSKMDNEDRLSKKGNKFDFF